MGWQIYESRSIGTPLRWAGYGVPAYCDHPKCNEEIDRGVSYVCGGVNSKYEDRGCGLHFCMKHLDSRQLCSNCAHYHKPFKAKLDHPEWSNHVLTHESWKEWRDKNPEYEKIYGESATKLIPLTQGKFAVVDFNDYKIFMRLKWYYIGGYAARNKYLKMPNGERKLKRIYMHRLVMNEPIGLQVDHIDGDKLNNTRKNLRICTNQQNQQNSKSRVGKSSVYKGVRWSKRDKNWQSCIKANSKDIHLGSFKTEEDAALAYNNAATKYFGEFARLNEVVRGNN